MVDINKPRVDAVLVGFGWTGAIMGMELTEAGLNVVALERGENRDTYPDFAYPRIADELTYGIRHKLFQNLARDTVTIRHSLRDRALPYRQLGSFLPGSGVGGGGCIGMVSTGAFCPRNCVSRAIFLSATARTSYLTL